MIFDPYQRMLHTIAETQRRVATADRMGTVTDVKQDGGEQKIRVEIGLDPDGKPLKGPWMSTVDKRGATREQHQYKKGQNVRISGQDGDYRQATVSAWAEGKSFPQPDSAPEHGYGDSYQAGKLHTGQWLPEDDDQQQQGGQGGQGGGQGGGQSGSGGQGQDKNHRHEVWIAKDDNKPPAHSGKSRVDSSTEGDAAKPEQQQQQQGQKKKLEEAVMHSVDEKNGFTARVGKDVRVAAHPEGAKTRAGKSYYSAKKDDDVVMHGEKDTYHRTEENFYYATIKGSPFINKPWQIKFEKKDDEIPNDDQLGNKKSGGGGGGK